MPCYLPVMQFAHSSALREKLYRAYVTRASDQAEGDARKFDNTALIRKSWHCARKKRSCWATPTLAKCRWCPRWPKSPAEVIDFLRDLAHGPPFAEKDVADLRAFAAESWVCPTRRPGTGPTSRKAQGSALRLQRAGGQAVLHRAQGAGGAVQDHRDAVRGGHPPRQRARVAPGVEFYRIERNGQLVGQFYLDQPARAGKRGGAWMDDVRTRWLRPDTGQLQTPVAHLVCNFADGVDGKPPLLTHDDVITLFHEFGHGLHHMLTQVNERDVSGISGVEWDAVELPSQFMENFCWEWDVLQAHDGPRRHRRAAAARAVRQDDGRQELPERHADAAPDRVCAVRHAAAHRARPGAGLHAAAGQVRNEVAVLQPPAFSRTAHTFSHIFAGGYAAGYYSYKWAEVLSADAYAAFEETAGARRPAQH
jgi:oligopeptidase A